MSECILNFFYLQIVIEYFLNIQEYLLTLESSAYKHILGPDDWMKERLKTILYHMLITSVKKVFNFGELLVKNENLVSQRTSTYLKRPRRGFENRKNSSLFFTGLKIIETYVLEESCCTFVCVCVF